MNASDSSDPATTVAHEANSGAVKPLTDQSFWDGYWAGVTLPTEVKPTDSLFVKELLAPFEEYLPVANGLSALEIGGAPGGYVVYMHRRFGYDISVLDYSEVGCALARENFRLLRIPARVYEGDLFEDIPDMPRFDVVYSLGLVEHFQDLSAVMAAHLRHVKPNGIIAVGCPNFLGVNGRIIERLSPSLLTGVQTSSMDIDSWTFEGKFDLDRLFLGYVGGFEALTFWRCESRRWRDRSLRATLTLVGRVLNRRPFAPLRRLNSRLWSGYVVGVYRVPPRMPRADVSALTSESPVTRFDQA